VFVMNSHEQSRKPLLGGERAWLDVAANLSPVRVLVAITTIVFGITLGHGILGWDDGVNVAENPWIAAGELWRFWVHPYFGLYIPVSYTLWGLLGLIFGQGNAFIFHLLNVSLHALNAVLVFKAIGLFLNKLRGDKSSGSHLAALLGALLFCVHPLQMGTVGWISAGRDLLSACFGLLAVNEYYGRSSRRPSARSLGWFVLALLSKPSVATLPLFLLVLDALILRLPSKESLRRLSPWFLAVVPAILVTKLQQPESIAQTESLSFWSRCLVAVDALGFYIQKLFVPLNLAADHGRTPQWVLAGSAYITTGVVAGLALAVTLLLSRFFGKAVLVGVLWWSVLLLPVLGFVPFAYQAVSTTADHYTYLPMVGMALAFSAIVERFRPSVLILAAGVLVALSCMSIVRAQVWKDNQSFYGDMLQKNPQSDRALLGISGDQIKEGKLREAEVTLRRAIEMNKWNPALVGNLGLVLYRQNRFFEAISEVQSRLQDKEFMARAEGMPRPLSILYLYLGASQVKLEKLWEAHESFCETVFLNPDSGDAKFNVSQVRAAIKEKSGSEPKCKYETMDGRKF
jgi:protein O-mannosyl-transferase